MLTRAADLSACPNYTTLFTLPDTRSRSESHDLTDTACASQEKSALMERVRRRAPRAARNRNDTDQLHAQLAIFFLASGLPISLPFLCTPMLTVQNAVCNGWNVIV